MHFERFAYMGIFLYFCIKYKNLKNLNFVKILKKLKMIEKKKKENYFKNDKQ